MCQPNFRQHRIINKKEFYRKLNGKWAAYLSKKDELPVIINCLTLREATKGMRDFKHAADTLGNPLSAVKL